jgi:hypothetical protein
MQDLTPLALDDEQLPVRVRSLASAYDLARAYAIDGAAFEQAWRKAQSYAARIERGFDITVEPAHSPVPGRVNER